VSTLPHGACMCRPGSQRGSSRAPLPPHILSPVRPAGAQRDLGQDPGHRAARRAAGAGARAGGRAGCRRGARGRLWQQRAGRPPGGAGLPGRPAAASAEPQPPAIRRAAGARAAHAAAGARAGPQQVTRSRAHGPRRPARPEDPSPGVACWEVTHAWGAARGHAAGRGRQDRQACVRQACRV